MTFKFKAGDKVVLNTDHYPDNTTNGIYNTEWKDKVFVVGRVVAAAADIKWSKGAIVDLEGTMYVVCGSMLSFANEASNTFSLANTKIDVHKYANENNVSLKQAHEEIQTWLLKEQGVIWNSGSKDVINTTADVLFIDSSSLNLNYGWREDMSWGEDDNKEIFLTRSVSLSAAYAKEETIEISGKKYNKADVEKALAGLAVDE